MDTLTPFSDHCQPNKRPPLSSLLPRAFWNEPKQTSCNYPYCVTKKAAYRDRRLKGFHWRALAKCTCVGFSKARSDLEGDFCHHVVGFRSCSAMLLDESYSWIIKWPDIKCSDRKKDDCTQSSIWNIIKLYIFNTLRTKYFHTSPTLWRLVSCWKGQTTGSICYEAHSVPLYAS